MTTKTATRTVTTAWGKAVLVDELTLPQRAGDKEFTCHVQLLAADDGETFVRFAYATGGVARRGPVTLRAADLEQLRAALRDHRELAQALGFDDRAAGRRGGNRR